jgi:hypothetical protein
MPSTYATHSLGAAAAAPVAAGVAAVAAAAGGGVGTGVLLHWRHAVLLQVAGCAHIQPTLVVLTELELLLHV